MLIDLPLLPVTGCRSVQTSVGCKQRWIEQGVEQENVEEIFYEDTHSKRYMSYLVDVQVPKWDLNLSQRIIF